MFEGQLRRLLEETKYRQSFSPREAAAAKKSELAVQGLSRSGALAQEVAAIYLRGVERVLDEFADIVVYGGEEVLLRHALRIRVTCPVSTLITLEQTVPGSSPITVA